MIKALINGTIFTGDERISGKALLMDEDIIAGIVGQSEPPSGTYLIDCRGESIAPGFIDLQIAGAGGYLFSANINPSALENIAGSILKTGTTSFLIVLPTNSAGVYRNAIRTVRENKIPGILGLHLEGPFINPVRKGAHPQQYIKKPEKEEVESLLGEAEGIVKMVTLAPELCNSKIIRQIGDYGIVVCAGHSNASFNVATIGFGWGIKSVTHIFNAMSPLHHREPGLPGAAFRSDKVFASIVADGIHVDFNMIAIAKSIMKERLFLVSDAVEESRTGAVPHVRQEDRFTLPDGTLSGSALTLMKAVQNCTEKAGIQLDEALRMASTYPAKLMGLEGIGRLDPGCKADVVVFDREYNIRHVFKDGKVVDG